VADATTGAIDPIPAARARTPYESPNASTAIVSGKTARAPAPNPESGVDTPTTLPAHGDPASERGAAAVDGELGPGISLERTPGLRFPDEVPQLLEELGRRGTGALERFDAAEPLQYCLCFVHVATVGDGGQQRVSAL
jgi:hypothetical protein